jgi:hypothetical protein
MSMPYFSLMVTYTGIRILAGGADTFVKAIQPFQVVVA